MYMLEMGVPLSREMEAGSEMIETMRERRYYAYGGQLDFRFRKHCRSVHSPGLSLLQYLVIVV